MPLGRPRGPGTDAERAEARRAKVRQNVQNFRRRQKEKQLVEQAEQPFGKATSSKTVSRSGSISHNSTDLKTRAGLRLRTQGENELADEKLEFGGAYQDAFISALQYRYLPEAPVPSSEESEPNVRVAVCCSTWVNAACLRTGEPGAEMVSDALLASALNIISEERNDPEMAMDAVQVHTRALNRLRLAFDKFSAGEESVELGLLSLAALTCAMSELLANKSWDNFAKHLQGVGALIEHSGLDALTTPAARDHFYSYRVIEAAFCFSQNHESFLCRREWIDFHWKQDYPLSNHPIHLMLDVALEIPPERKRFETTALRSPSNLRERLQRLRIIALQLDRWKLDMDLSYDEPIYTMRPAKWEGLHAEAIDFGNLAMASAFTLYTGVRVHLFNLIKEVADELSVFEGSAGAVSESALKESLKWARLSCQCHEYFHADNKKIVGNLVCLFPFDAAWECFTRVHQAGVADLSAEVSWCQSMAEKFSDRGLPVLKWRTAV